MLTIDTLFVSPDATCLDALAAIDAGGVGLCLVVRNTDELVGVLTDGDVRRGLLGGATLDAAIRSLVNERPVTVGTKDDRASVLELMRARRLHAIPTLADGRVVGIHTLQEIIGNETRPNWAVLMAGGKGARLGNLTASVPKPMLRVAGRPILERIALQVIGAGVRKLAISVNHMASVIEDHFGEGDALGCEIRYLREEENLPLGTAGSLALLADVGIDTADPILVLNGDIMTPSSLGPLIDTHATSGCAITVGASSHNYRVPFGVLTTDDDGLLAEIEEKPLYSWRVGAGIYVVQPDTVSLIPRDVPFDMPDLCEAVSEAGRDIGVYDLGADWIDIGRPTDLSRARGESAP